MNSIWRTDYGSDDYRRVYDGQLAKHLEAEERADALKRMWAIQLKVRTALLQKQGTPDYDLEAYCYRRGKMAELEREISRAKWRSRFHLDIWNAMDPPTKRRPRKTVLVDGIRTKIEREHA